MYSPKYPHEKYTVGFTRMPHSGPEFYLRSWIIHWIIVVLTLEERKFKMGPDRYAAWAMEAFGSVEEADEKAI